MANLTVRIATPLTLAEAQLLQRSSGSDGTIYQWTKFSELQRRDVGYTSIIHSKVNDKKLDRLINHYALYKVDGKFSLVLEFNPSDTLEELGFKQIV